MQLKPLNTGLECRLLKRSKIQNLSGQCLERSSHQCFDTKSALATFKDPRIVRSMLGKVRPNDFKVFKHEYEIFH